MIQQCAGFCLALIEVTFFFCQNTEVDTDFIQHVQQSTPGIAGL